MATTAENTPHAHTHTHKRKVNGSRKVTPKDLGVKAADLALQELGEVWNKAEGSIKEHSAETRDKLLKYTKEHPLTALGGAMVAGALLALLLRR